MTICFQESAEIIPRMNSHLGDHDIVTIVGLEVIVKDMDTNKSKSYVSDIVHICKKSVDEEHLGVIGKNNITRYHMNKILKNFEEKAKQNILVEVIESDGYTRRLINANTIIAVRSFAANPEDDLYKDKGLYAIASRICDSDY